MCSNADEEEPQEKGRLNIQVREETPRYPGWRIWVDGAQEGDGPREGSQPPPLKRK